ncbi:unknown [Coraliomargarita sp. CAG:312]|nr:unknown [Coraliomargarita sp. CAG:312]
MGTGAKVAKFSIAVHSNFFAFWNIGESAELEFCLAAFLNHFCGGLAVDFNTLETLVLGNHFLHLGFYGSQVLGGELMVQVEVVIKARFGRWADVELCVGEQS